MILIHYSQNGMKRTADLTDIYSGQTAMLVGGAPSLKTQALNLLAQRGVLTMAMNNAGMHFQSSLWCGVDRPECYDPQLMLDPRIIKLGNIAHAETQLNANYGNRKFRQLPNMYFYLLEERVPWSEFLSVRRAIPWYNNTLFTSICILYHFGVRRIILAGSDFSSGYAHNTTLTSLEQKWNADLYNSQVHELRRFKPIFDKAGLEFLDCSANSRIAQVYKKITMEEAVELCLSSFPLVCLDSTKLPHCSKFANTTIQEQIAKWPGYKLVQGETEPVPQPHIMNEERRTVV